MTRGRSRRTKWLAMQSPMKEPASVAVITQRASMRRPRPMLAVANDRDEEPVAQQAVGHQGRGDPAEGAHHGGPDLQERPDRHEQQAAKEGAAQHR